MYARQLRILRKQSGMTQQQVADVLRIDRSTYCNYENGKRDIGLGTVHKLSKFYKVPIARFFEDTPEEFAYDECYYEEQEDLRYLSHLSKKEIDIVSAYRISNAEGQKLIAEYSKNISETMRGKLTRKK